MHMNKIRAIAKKMSIDPGPMDKKELIRFIQEQEGNIPCFKTDQHSCDQDDCCWRDDCKPGEIIAMS
jgi:hypothetical protein